MNTRAQLPPRSDLDRQMCATSHFARGLLDASLDPMMVIDMQRRVTDVNRAAEDITGWGRSQLIGTDLLEWFSKGEEISDLVLRALHQGQVRDHPMSVRHKSGRMTEVLCSVTIYRDADGTALGAFFAARDVTDLRQYQTQISFQATCDALTALPNRRGSPSWFRPPTRDETRGLPWRVRGTDAHRPG